MLEEVQTTLIAPYGGELVNLLAPPHEAEALKDLGSRLPSLQLSDRSVCDLEMLAVGGFSPLRQFMGQKDYQRVVSEMRLADGTLFPIPITLPVEDAKQFKLGSQIALRDPNNNLLAVMTVEEIFAYDRDEEAQHVLGTRDTRHPLVAEMHRWGKHCLAGRLQVLQLPPHYDFEDLRLTPRQVRDRLESMRSNNVVGFQTRNPLHRVHEELTRRAANEVDGTLLLHPAVGMTRQGDVDYFTRVRTYKALRPYYDEKRFLLALAPFAMRMAGPREAVWHAIIRRNYGANHFIVGRDHAGPGNDSQGKPFYGPYDAQNLAEKHSAELGLKILPFTQLVYLPREDRYEEVGKIAEGTETASISGTQVRVDYLQKGLPLPSWFTRPEVSTILSEQFPPRYRQGFCVWFTGLSGAGKSTTAGVLNVLLMEHGRNVNILDGDVVRTFLSKGLTFSKEDRDENIRRIGWVASEVVSQGGAVLAAAVSPYLDTRNEVRAMMEEEHFIEVFVSTPLDVCEKRDSKGIYAKARRGEIKGFTGIDDPYEAPVNPELSIDTVKQTPLENARLILEHLRKLGFVR